MKKPEVKLQELTPGANAAMANLVYSRDWSATPLGPIESWPQSLRTTVSLCLASNFPISIAWGPQRVQIYNDGYWPICGDKHPVSMGQDYKECWMSAWPVIGEAFEQASLGHTRFLENQRMFLDRKGYLEETFFTFSFSPILDESGDVGGLFHPVTELTQQSLAERRLNILRNVAEQTVGAKTVEEASALILDTLKQFDLDLPFVLLYAISENKKEAHLKGTVGIENGSSLAPLQINLEVLSEENWPLNKVGQAKSFQVDLQQIFGKFTCGPYPESLNKALIFPVSFSGTPQPDYFMVCGVSSRRALDEKYLLFYDLLREAVSNAFIKARAYEQERKKAETLAELDRAKTIFFSNISHEFRTPLTLMLGPLEDSLLDNNTPLPKPHRERLELVQRNTLRLQRLVNSLLDFSRIEAGRLKASFRSTNISEYTCDLASMFRSAIEKAGLTYSLTCHQVNDPVFVDHDMWEKIVFNLLSNALKFTFQGSISIGLTEEQSQVVLTVTDTGEGIPEKEIVNLFKRFYRIVGTKSRTFEGSGIGLALVHELVKLHGGTIEVQSEIKKGTKFSVRIPKGAAHLPQEYVVRESSETFAGIRSEMFINESNQWLLNADLKPAGFTEKGKEKNYRHTILVADDNADMREYIVRILTQNKEWNVQSVTDGIEALESIKKQMPHLVLSDVMMPRLDGFGLLKELKENPDTSRIPVIFLSARAGEEAVVEGLGKGADDYLVKPFSARELLARVKTQLEITTTRQDNTELRKAQEELKKFKILSDHAFDAFILMREDGSFAYLNDLALERWGYSKQEAKNLRVPDVDPFVQEEKFKELFSLAQHQIVPPFETLHKTKNGSTLPVEVSMGGIELSGEPHMFAVARDITDRKKNEEYLKKALQQKDDFISIASHELKTPVTVLKASTQILQATFGKEGNTGPYALLTQMDNQINKLTRLIVDLLDVSTIDKGEIRFSKEEFDFNNLVKEVVEEMQRTVRSHKIQVSLSHTTNVSADRSRIAQVITNLFSNAIKYSPRANEIIVSSNIENGNVRFSVQDFGIGIPEDQLEHVFERFFRVEGENQKTFPGLGLGLFISSEIIRRHTGSMFAESKKGKGSIFSFTLPVNNQPGDSSN